MPSCRLVPPSQPHPHPHPYSHPHPRGLVCACVDFLPPVGGCGVGNLTEPVAISLRHWAEGAEPVAAWWSQEGPGGAGGWSSEGCQLRSSQPNVSSLHCQHLGNVAVLMVGKVGPGGEGQGTGRCVRWRWGSLITQGHREMKDSSLVRPQNCQDSRKCPSGLPAPPPPQFSSSGDKESCFYSPNESGGSGTTQAGLLRPSLHSPRSRL